MPATYRRPVMLMGTGLTLFLALLAFNLYAMWQVEHATRQRALAREARLTNVLLVTALTDAQPGRQDDLRAPDPRASARCEAALRRAARLRAHLVGQADQLEGESGQLTRLQALVRQQALVAGKRRAADCRAKGAATPGDAALIATIRGRAAAIEQLLRREIDRRNAEVASVMRVTYGTEVGLGVVGAGAMLGSMLLLRSAQGQRRRAEQALQRSHRELEIRVAERTVELEDARHQLELFAGQLDRGIEAERRRLARELHDQLGQVFTALTFALGQLRGTYEVPAAELQAVDGLLREGIATTRRIAGELRPPLLDEFGLAAAVEHRADAFQRETGIPVEVDLGQTEHLDRDQAVQLFRIVQEALTNVARHAGAAGAWIRGIATGDDYELRIDDDGRGLRSKRGGSMGLLSMRERAALAGGWLTLERSPRGGLRVRVSVPIGRENA